MGLITGWQERRAVRREAERVSALREEALRLQVQGRMQEAEAGLREVVAVRTRLRGGDDPGVLLARSDLAMLLLVLGRVEEADAEADECLEGCRRSLGEAHDVTGKAAVARARVLLAQGRHRHSEEEAAKVMAARGDRPSDLTYLSARGAHAHALGNQGRHAEAVEEFAALSRAWYKMGRAGQPLVVKARSDRAQHLIYLGRYEAAEAECRALTELAGPKGVNRPRARLAAGIGLVVALAHLDRFEEGEAVAREAIAQAPAELDGHFHAVLRLGLARCLNGQGRWQEALETASTAQADLRESPPGRQSYLPAAGIPMGTALIGLGRSMEAVSLLRESVELCGSLLAPSHHRTLEAELVLGTALAARGSRAEAVETLIANHAAWSEHFGEAHPKTLAATRELAAARESTSTGGGPRVNGPGEDGL
ncbi:tetratricopeptide repeat protein [Kitasatospora sp. NPDC001175]|uniref:tetratricopeptide repeat protein n=1 Tax=Kitasatospora sp. NPDC001175 TaxID=3157103 RepID=UPI003CFD6C07